MDVLSDVRKHLPHTKSGKVREVYAIPHAMLLLPIATDRISIFDFVLPFTIPRKGECLTAINIFYRLQLQKELPLLQQDLIAYGQGIDRYLPLPLRGRPELWRVATVVRNAASGLAEVPYELIVRGYLTGSGYEAYKKTGAVCGTVLSEGLVNGAALPEPLFTPTNKAHEGHDEHVSWHEVVHKCGPEPKRIALDVYKVIAHVAARAGLIAADTKVEATRTMLTDEVGTPDSTRYWDVTEYLRCFPNKLPPSLDKEYVRQWGRSVGIHAFDPTKSEDRALVSKMVPPPEVVRKTSALYLHMVERLTGMSLPVFQREVMGIP